MTVTTKHVLLPVAISLTLPSIVYTPVWLLYGVQIVMFLAELNELNFWSTDIGNAYLKSDTMEKIYIVGGKEFECIGMQGHTLVIIKEALYRLKSSGMSWWGVLADVLRQMGFVHLPRLIMTSGCIPNRIPIIQLKKIIMNTSWSTWMILALHQKHQKAHCQRTRRTLWIQFERNWTHYLPSWC
jgi:hypothetical protein